MVTSKFGLNQLKFNKGSKIYAKGDKADFAYYVHTGKVNIYSPGGLLLGQIGEGEIFEKEVPLSMNQDQLQQRPPQVVFYIPLVKKR